MKIREYSPEEAAQIAARMRAKAARRRNWAESAERQAAAAHEASRAATAGIPFGQPILLGHHSQRRHERAIERAHSKLGQAVEADRRAQHHSRKADRQEGWAAEVERRARGAVYTQADLQPGDRISRTDGHVSDVIVRANAKSVTAWAVYNGQAIDTPDDELAPIWPQFADRNPSRLPYLKIREVWRNTGDGWEVVTGTGPGAQS